MMQLTQTERTFDGDDFFINSDSSLIRHLRVNSSTKSMLEFRSHRGEVSFPGGRLDGEETAEQGALREAAEEVGSTAAWSRWWVG